VKYRALAVFIWAGMVMMSASFPPLSSCV